MEESYTLVFQHVTRRKVLGTHGATRIKRVGLVAVEAVTASPFHQRLNVLQHLVHAVLKNTLQTNQPLSFTWTMWNHLQNLQLKLMSALLMNLKMQRKLESNKR
eukprot:4747591-Amphidinium_carterae.1